MCRHARRGFCTLFFSAIRYVVDPRIHYKMGFSLPRAIVCVGAQVYVLLYSFMIFSVLTQCGSVTTCNLILFISIYSRACLCLLYGQQGLNNFSRKPSHSKSLGLSPSLSLLSRVVSLSLTSVVCVFTNYVGFSLLFY